MAERILAVVVSYQPRIAAFELALAALVDQVEKVLVIDNASENVDAITKLLKERDLDTVELARQSSNLGLGAAHNLGIAHAREHGFSHVLLMDQDSVPLTGMVAALSEAAARKAEQGKVAAVGASYINADNGAESFFIRFGWLKFKRQYCGRRDSDGCIRADFLISSGSLISIDALDEVGDMDESLFIDHIDTEWFLRARGKRFYAWGVCDAIMQHGLGEHTHQINLRRQRNVPQHKPFRYYYIFRNSMLLYLRGYPSLLWKWNDLQRLTLIALMFGLFKGPRRENARMMWRGLCDGVRGKTGPLRTA